MRKITGALGLAAATALALSACSAGGNGADENTIVVDMWAGSDEDIAVLQSQIDIAQEQVPGATIELRTAPWEAFYSRLTTNIATNNMACITGMTSAQLTSYVEGFRALSADDLETAGIDLADFTPGSDELLMANGGELYGVPFDVATMVAYYNEDLLNAAGAPIPEPGWTFDDFEETVTTATTPEHSGFAVALSEAQWQSLPIAYGGTQPVADDGTLQLTNPDFVDAATWYAGLVTDQGVAQPVSSASDGGWGENQYSSGNVAMAIDGTWNAVRYLTNDSGFTAGLAPLPSNGDAETGLSLVLGSGYGIAESCENPELALQVLGALVGQDAQNTIAETGRSLPALTASQPLYYESLDPAYGDQVRETFEAAFQNVEGQRVPSNWAQVGTFLLPQLVSVYSGQTSMSDVLSSAQQQFGE